MSGTLELNCLVQGNGPRNVFPVKIGSHESVGTLKKLIFDDRNYVFKGVDADTLFLDTLVLWKVSIPTNGIASYY